MARIRTIKPEFWQDERLSNMPRDARLLFIGLWNVADDYGRLRGHPAFIRGQVFPYDEDIDVEELLNILARGGRIVRYERDGQRFIWIRHFSEHQKMDKRTDSKLPEPTAEEMAASTQKRAEPAEKVEEKSEPKSQVREIASAQKMAESAEKKALEWKGKEGKGKDLSSVDSAGADPTAAGPEREVFEHWRKVMAKSDRTAFDDKRRRAVKGRLGDGYSAEDLKRAVDGCAKTPHNIGQNDRGERFDDLELICRDAAHVDRFIRNAKSPPRPTAGGGRASNADTDWSDVEGESPFAPEPLAGAQR